MHNVFGENKLRERISKTAAKAAQTSLRPFGKHKNVFKCPRIHTQATFCEALKPQNIMHLKSSPWPLRSTDWCFNQRDPERLLTNLHYFILFLFFLLFFSFFHSFSTWLRVHLAKSCSVLLWL